MAGWVGLDRLDGDGGMDGGCFFFQGKGCNFQGFCHEVSEVGKRLKLRENHHQNKRKGKVREGVKGRNPSHQKVYVEFFLGQFLLKNIITPVGEI